MLSNARGDVRRSRSRRSGSAGAIGSCSQDFQLPSDATTHAPSLQDPGAGDHHDSLEPCWVGMMISDDGPASRPMSCIVISGLDLRLLEDIELAEAAYVVRSCFES